jgi:hypothetical protein
MQLVHSSSMVCSTVQLSRTTDKTMTPSSPVALLSAHADRDRWYGCAASATPCHVATVQARWPYLGTIHWSLFPKLLLLLRTHHAGTVIPFTTSTSLSPVRRKLVIDGLCKGWQPSLMFLYHLLEPAAAQQPNLVHAALYVRYIVYLGARVVYRTVR